MLITMGIGLFTSRVVLNTLGINDYGIYDVVAGVITMFSFFTTSLSTAISRFLTYSLGKNDKTKLSVIFSTSVNIQLAVAVIVVVVAEVLGVWFVNNKLNIPEERIAAANYVIHFSTVILAFQVISIPYSSTIIAHERMNAFAYISILESILKLCISLLLYIAPFDLLIIYAFLLVVVQAIVLFSYWIYCRHKFEECLYRFCIDKSLIKEMSGFAGWNLVGTGAYMLNTQGVNILINIYFGVAANAARGIANQIRGLMMQFVNSFTTAINPQITKSYASDDFDYLFKLICNGAKYSYYLMLIFLVPIIFEVEWVLDVWLKNYPPLAPVFIRLMIIGQMIDFLGNSSARAVWATGKVRKYFIVTSLIGPLVFPLSYLFYYLGFPVESAYWIFIVVYSFLVPVRLSILNELIGFPPSLFYKKVLLPCLYTTVFAFLAPFLISSVLKESIIKEIVVIIVSLISVISSIWFVGIDVIEKNYISKSLFQYLKSKA